MDVDLDFPVRPLVPKLLRNGPEIGITGKRSDLDLPSDKFHVLLWTNERKTAVQINSGTTNTVFSILGETTFTDFDAAQILRQAVYNVDEVFGFEELRDTLKDELDVDPAELTSFKEDLVAICWILGSCNYYGHSTRTANDKVTTNIEEVDLGSYSDILAPQILSRAVTLLSSRLVCKHQTNQILGGSKVAKSPMTLAIQQLYGLDPEKAGDEQTMAKLNFYMDGLFWALYPANEILLLPLVLNNTRIPKAEIHSCGPSLSLIDLKTYLPKPCSLVVPPSSTEDFWIVATAANILAKLEILKYLPNPSRLRSLISGVAEIQVYGARLHPGAKHWSLEEKTFARTCIDTLKCDIEYAIEQTTPTPFLIEHDRPVQARKLDPNWKIFIDELRAAMEKRGDKMLTRDIIDDVTRRAPVVGGSHPEARDVARLNFDSSAPVPQDLLSTYLWSD